jgi:hypothetical protein
VREGFQLLHRIIQHLLAPVLGPVHRPRSRLHLGDPVPLGSGVARSPLRTTGPPLPLAAPGEWRVAA